MPQTSSPRRPSTPLPCRCGLPLRGESFASPPPRRTSRRRRGGGGSGGNQASLSINPERKSSSVSSPWPSSQSSNSSKSPKSSTGFEPWWSRSPIPPSPLELCFSRPSSLARLHQPSFAMLESTSAHRSGEHDKTSQLGLEQVNLQQPALIIVRGAPPPPLPPSKVARR